MSGPRRGTLWLHVGTHKTGTTSVQQALRVKSAELSAAGIATYPEPNAWKLANTIIRPELETTPRVSMGFPRPSLRMMLGLRDLVAAARGDREDMVISSEEFCLLRTPIEAFAVLHALAPDFARVEPIIVLRNPDQWRAARADQLKKTGNWDHQKSLPDWISCDGEWYYDRDAICAFWQDVGHFRVIDYDAECRDTGDILPAFASAIGVGGLFDDVKLRLNARERRV